MARALASRGRMSRPVRLIVNPTSGGGRALEALPRTGTSKVQKSEVRELFT